MLLARRCLDALSDNARSNYISTGPIPAEQAIRIYKVRAEINREKPGLIEGFDELLKDLSVEKENLVEIHAFEGHEEVFVVFTNPSTTRLIGILIIKGKTLSPPKNLCSP
jgi:hypothetical protein